MARWRIKVTTLTYAGNTLLFPYMSPSTLLEDTQAEYTATFNRVWQPTISGVPYADITGNDVLELPISIARDYGSAASLFKAVSKELYFARNNPVGSLSLSTEGTEVTQEAVLELAAATSAQANVRYVHVSAEAFYRAWGARCSAIGIQGGTSNSLDGSNTVPKYLAVWSTEDTSALDTTEPELLGVSTEAVACSSNQLNRWEFLDLKLPPGNGMNLRLAMVPDAGSREWTPNSFPYLRAAMAASDGSLGFTSNGNNQTNTAYFPHVVFYYTSTSRTDSSYLSYDRALLTSLTHRVVLALRRLRLISTWTFAVSLPFVAPPEEEEGSEGSEGEI